MSWPSMEFLASIWIVIALIPLVVAVFKGRINPVTSVLVLALITPPIVTLAM